MLDVRILIAAIPLAILLTCCSSAPPPTQSIGTADTIPEGAAYPDSILLEALRDSLDSEPYDYMFFEIHSEIMRRIDELEAKGEKNSRIIEAKAIISIAEEVYLEGDPVLAIKLLSEAELILRQAP
jgi:hypothetical protein